MGEWKKIKLFEVLTESRELTNKPNPEKRITVRLNVKGVQQREATKDKEGATKYYIRRSGQFIYGRQNLHKGAFGVIPPGLDGFESSADLPSFDVNKSCRPEWILYFLKKQNYYEQLVSIARGVGSQRIAPEEFLQIEIPLPDKPIQVSIINKIVNAETNVQKIIEEFDNQYELLKKLRQAVLQEAIEGRLTAKWRDKHPDLISGDNHASKLLEKIKAEKERLINERMVRESRDINNSKTIRDLDIPKSWQWVKGDDIFFVTKLAGFEYTKYIKLKEAGDIPVIRAQNVRPLRISKNSLLFIDAETSKLLDRSALNKECLLVTFIGAGIGDVALFDEHERWHLAPNVAKMEPYGQKEYLNLRYLNYYLLSSVGQKEIFKHVKATAQPCLSMGTIRDIDYPLPPLSEQNATVERIDRALTMIDDLEKQVSERKEQSEMLMQSVLQEAFAG